MEKLTLYVDTSNKDLVVGLSKEDKIIYKKQYEASKKHSELAGVEIKKAFEKTKQKVKDLTKIVVCNGPGSYTGIRVGLTLAKVLTKSLKTKLVLLDKTSILAGVEGKKLAVIDARSNNAYFAFYNNGKRVGIIDKNKVKNIKENSGSATR